MYKITCTSCDHVFYDITVECDDDLGLTCPVCGKSTDTYEKMPKPDDATWSEDTGCVHEDGKHSCKGCTGGCGCS